MDYEIQSNIYRSLKSSLASLGYTTKGRSTIGNSHYRGKFFSRQENDNGFCHAILMANIAECHVIVMLHAFCSRAAI